MPTTVKLPLYNDYCFSSFTVMTLTLCMYLCFILSTKWIKKIGLAFAVKSNNHLSGKLRQFVE